MVDTNNLSKLEIVALYNDLKPMYDVIMEEFKADFLETGEKFHSVQLPNDAKMILERKEEYERHTFNSTVAKKELANLGVDVNEDRFIKISKIAPSCTAKVVYDCE